MKRIFYEWKYLMKRIFRKLTPIKQVVFKATIELNSEYREQNSEYYEILKPNGKYWFRKKEKKVSYEELVDFLTETIEYELLPEVNKGFKNNPVRDVKIIGVNEGSIEIIFSVLLFAGTSVLSGIFYDLLKNAVRRLLKRKLNYFGDFFDVNVIVISPSKNRNYVENEYEIDNKKRDTFFYYLLFSNIVLIGIVIYLVLKAVIMTYGW